MTVEPPNSKYPFSGDQQCILLGTFIKKFVYTYNNDLIKNATNLNQLLLSTNTCFHLCMQLNKPESLIEYVKDRPGHDLRYAMNPKKIESELGWKPSVTFEEGLDQTIDWYLNNKGWWEHILSGEYKNYFDKMYGNRLSK